MLQNTFILILLYLCKVVQLIQITISRVAIATYTLILATILITIPAIPVNRSCFLN